MSVFCLCVGILMGLRPSSDLPGSLLTRLNSRHVEKATDPSSPKFSPTFLQDRHHRDLIAMTSLRQLTRSNQERVFSKHIQTSNSKRRQQPAGKLLGNCTLTLSYSFICICPSCSEVIFVTERISQRGQTV